MSIKRYRNSALLRFNIEAHLNREFINKGLYSNIASGHLDVNSNRADVLRRVDSNLYESLFDRWIFETDASGIAGFRPIIASGVFVDDGFFPKGDTPYEPTIDYDNGRVIFKGAPVPDTAEVRAEFSYKQAIVDFPNSNVANLLFSQTRDQTEFTIYSHPSGNQRQVPAVIIDLQDSRSSPWQLGGGKIVNQRVVFHVIANDDNELDQVADILTDQFRKVIQGVDFNKAPELFTSDGDTASTYKNYTQLQGSGTIAWSKIFIDEVRLMERAEFFEYKRARIDWRVLFHRPPND